MKYYLISGEASGDLHGSHLIAALKKLDPNARFRAWGGSLMEKEGAELVKHFKDLAFMGFWEVAKTSWGAPIEPNSTAKSKTYYSTHKLVCDINDGKEMCLGTFAFRWGWKQEKTSTWFGMCLPNNGEITASRCDG